MIIFRFDQGEIEGVLATAVSRGVDVHRLIAHTDRGPHGRRVRALSWRAHAGGSSRFYSPKSGFGAAWHY